MEDELNLVIELIHCDVHYLIGVIDSLHHMGEFIEALDQLCSDYARSLLPDIVPLLQSADVLILSHELLLFLRSKIKYHLLWLSHGMPCDRLQVCLNQVERELEDSLVMLLLLIRKVLAQLHRASRDAVKSPPATVV